MKEEIDEELQIQEALKLSAVLSTIGLVDEVADEPVATEETAPEAELDLSIFDTVTEPENPAQAAFDDIDQLRDDPAVDLPTTSEPAPVETIDLLDLGDDYSFEHRVIAEASVPDPTVADTAGVATEATAVDTSDIVPPPTSPNLVEPGVEPIQVGHTPSAPSRPPRTRQTKFSRGGQVTRWQEANREWWKDFERVSQWLYQNSGGKLVGGFHLKRISYQQATDEITFVVCRQLSFAD